MRPLYVRNPVGCRDFHQWVYHLQADELADTDREKLLEHCAGCETCARYLEVEDSFLRALKGRLIGEVAPDGLEARIREALEREAPAAASGAGSRVRTPAVSALAAALLLAALLIPTLVGGAARDASSAAPSRVLRVVRTVTVVDHHCDRMGATFAEQAACGDARHLNVLKVSDGSYWNINIGDPSARDIVWNRALRGQRITVEADLYPEIETVRLVRVHEAAFRL